MSETPRVCALIVTFQPDLAQLSQMVERLAPQVEGVLLVDNGSQPPPSLASPGADSLHWLRLERNLGLGAAQNLGIRWAREQGFSHLLLSDQDSLFEPGIVATLMAGLRQLQAQGVRVAAVGPAYWDPRTDSVRPFVRFSGWGVQRQSCDGRSDLIETDFLIASGTLAPMTSFAQIGLVEEGFFIDNLDLEWSFRARSLGFRLFGVCRARLQHLLGDQVVKFWLFRWWHLYRHGPLRQYYIARNRVHLYRRSYSPRGWIAHDLVLFLVKICVFGLIFPPRRANLRMIWQGTRDGWRGRLGPHGEVAEHQETGSK